jgi:hypothetical protein
LLGFHQTDFHRVIEHFQDAMLSRQVEPLAINFLVDPDDI